MTTIAYRDGVLAADSRATVGDVIVSDQDRKIGRLPDGGLYALIGSAANVECFVRWLKTAEKQRGPRPKLEDHDSVVVIRSSGRVEVHQREGFFEESHRFVAFGSGKASALTAMHLGAGAVEAVKVARKIDVWTGGRVRSLVLGKR